MAARAKPRHVHRWITKFRRLLYLDTLAPLPRKIVVLLAGAVMLTAGAVMLVTPGPALVLIPAGLMLLASEFTFVADAVQRGLDLVAYARKVFQRRAKS
jgi:hypothetical protein